ncbi:NADPH-dependent FMN reductase [Paenibacillus humicola]|uniref:NADPH-dependent FMN reductase n=1 Tax=Paenibacillus humicola TaxID=3110540 RepID=UPI00237A5B91|nr:NADPH-dependent FMN reductase [Paenibacillus humicola]
MKIALIAGSNRRDAGSTKLIHYIAGLVRAEGHEAAVFDLHTDPLPMYSPDEIEAHSNVTKLRQTVLAADGVVLGTPEYHGSVSGALKNALDFLGFDHFDGKPVLSVSTAGGPVGVSSLQHMQTIVRNVHGINCSEWISIGGAQREFTADGEPADQDVRLRAGRTVAYFLNMIGRLRA